MEKVNKDVMNTNTVERDEAIDKVPDGQRGHWIGPASINAGLEFTIPVLTTGAILAGSFSLWTTFWIILVALAITWVGNALNGYMGAKTGRPSTVIARTSFGRIQARIVIGINIMIVCLFWWALQTHVAGDAIAAMFGISKETDLGIWIIIVLLAGITFAIPSILGYESMKWTDYIAVPAGLILIVFGIYLAVDNIGWSGITAWNPTSTMSVIAAISLVISVNISQWVGSADYTRYAKPVVKDNMLIPLGIVGVGFPLFMVGAIMSVGVGEADIVAIMLSLNFPVWGFIILYLATWTSQLVNNYSMGLALSNMFNVNSGKGRAVLTLVGTAVGLALAMTDIMTQFENFLYIIGLTTPPVAAIMMTDFFIIRKQQFKDIEGWNWVATVTMIIGFGFGYLTQYVYVIGMPLLQSFLLTSLLYYVGMKMKGKMKPDQFTAS
ncbi:cytosine permease [Virgibacillus oceani]